MMWGGEISYRWFVRFRRWDLASVMADDAAEQNNRPLI
jgi:hypothetical protein